MAIIKVYKHGTRGRLLEEGQQGGELYGELIHMFIYDIGISIPYDKVKALLQNPEDFSKYNYNAPAPEEIPTFNVPYIFNLRDEEATLGGRVVKARVQASIYEVGAVSIRVRLAIDGLKPEELSDMTFSKEVNEFAAAVAVGARRRVSSNLYKIAGISSDNYDRIPGAKFEQVSWTMSDAFPYALSERYRFYFLYGDRDEVLRYCGGVFAGLLVDEHDGTKLDAAYASEILSRRLSYMHDDGFFVGWEGCIMVDRSSHYDHELLIAEIANVQLLKLRVYRKRAAGLIKHTTNTVSEISVMGHMERITSKKAAKLDRELGAFSDDAGSMMNKMGNTAFGLGEWYLSQLYTLFSNVFKLNELAASLRSDLEVVGRRKLFAERAIDAKSTWNIEFAVLVLIVIEVLIEVAYLLK